MDAQMALRLVKLAASAPDYRMYHRARKARWAVVDESGAEVAQLSAHGDSQSTWLVLVGGLRSGAYSSRAEAFAAVVERVAQ